MRPGVTIHIGGEFGAREIPPPHHQHQMAPPAAGWKSPVPYLFGGLAAMLGLIAFALLILACSYWKLSGYLDAGEDSGEVTGDEKPKDSNSNATAVSYPSSILVIMAGEEKPTFLAMPATSRTSSLGDYEQSDKACSSSDGGADGGSSGGGGEEKVAELETSGTIGTTREEEKNRETTT
ncbi:hypothetical protein SOVF_101040 [Spinacia oleracea]|uniref:Protein GLUTAMINE DUMPER 2 n=1 Tax=Spinacia oleracea TaxID=3562 RepID=A0A9R0IWF9_SPIOL|nr:protein GLUTAMINE DUMPER 2-like [Spinacia oleracea]KNA15135.1 hypothetical protein SOVF_101040 [Spinacia oleracea]